MQGMVGPPLPHAAVAAGHHHHGRHHSRHSRGRSLSREMSRRLVMAADEEFIEAKAVLQAGLHDHEVTRVFGLKVYRIVDLWKPLLLVSVITMGFMVSVGVACDVVLFEAPLFHAWVLPLYGILATGLTAVRVVVRRLCRSSERIEDGVELLAFIAFFVVVFSATIHTTDLDIRADGRPSAAFQLRQHMLDIIFDEEFTAEDAPNRFKTFKDISNIGEMGQYLMGPLWDNLGGCNNAIEDFLLMEECIVGDRNQYVVRSSLRFREIRVKGDSENCAMSWSTQAGGGPPVCVPSTYEKSLEELDERTVSVCGVPVPFPSVNGTFRNYNAKLKNELPQVGVLATFPQRGYILQPPKDADSIMTVPWIPKAHTAALYESLLYGSSCASSEECSRLADIEKSCASVRQQRICLNQSDVADCFLGPCCNATTGEREWFGGCDLCNTVVSCAPCFKGRSQCASPAANHQQTKSEATADDVATMQRGVIQCVLDSPLFDAFTRVITLDLTISSRNRDLDATIIMTFEISGIGKVYPSAEVYVTKFPYTSTLLEMRYPPWGWPTGQCRSKRCTEANRIARSRNTRGGIQAYLADQFLDEALKAGRPISHDHGMMRVEPPAPNASEAERFDYESYTHASEDRYRLMHGSPFVDENYHILILATTLAVHFLVMEFEEMFKIGMRAYLTSGWNYLELASSLLICAAFGQNIAAMELTPGYVSTPVPFNQAHAVTGGLLALVNCIQTIKIIKYVSWLTRFQLLGSTLASSAVAVGNFFILLFCFLMGFTVAGFFAFGNSIAEYSTITRSIYTHLKALFGEFDYETPAREFPGIGHILPLLYMSLVLFVLVTVVVAIISHGYEFAQGAATRTRSPEELEDDEWLQQVKAPSRPARSAIRLIIRQARGLAAGDFLLQSSDAYVKLHVTTPPPQDDAADSKRATPEAKPEIEQAPPKKRRARRTKSSRKTFRSKTVYGTLNPEWNERAEFTCDVDDDRLIFSVFDEDIRSHDDFLGTATVVLSHLKQDSSPMHLIMPLHDYSTFDQAVGEMKADDEEPRSKGELRISISYAALSSGDEP